MFNVAVVGATGAVGGTMLRVLEERGFPVTELRPLASERSEGRRDRLPRPAAHGAPPHRRTSFEGIQIALFSAGSARAQGVRPGGRRGRRRGDRQLERLPHGRRRPARRARGQRADLEGHAGIVANPNCVAAPLVVALKPIADAVGLERVIVSSYQSVSGTGQAAVRELREQTAGLPGGRRARARGLPAPDRLQRAAAHRRLRRERLHRRGAQGGGRDAQDARHARPRR